MKITIKILILLTLLWGLYTHYNVFFLKKKDAISEKAYKDSLIIEKYDGNEKEIIIFNNNTNKIQTKISGKLEIKIDKNNVNTIVVLKKQGKQLKKNKIEMKKDLSFQILSKRKEK